MKKLTAIAIFIIIVAAVFIGWYFTRPDNSLVIAPASYDFGRINGQSVMRKDFIITNWHDKEIKLKDANGSQDDLSVKFLDNEGKPAKAIAIAKLQNATLRIEFNPARYLSLRGPTEREASFKTSRLRFWSVKIPIKATIIR